MPFSTTITPDGTGILRTGRGLVTGADLLAADSELLHATEKELQQIRYGLVDFSEVTELRVTSDDVRLLARLAERLSELNTEFIAAIVAPRDDSFGLSRMWQVLAEYTGWSSHVFRDRAGAIAWLLERVPGLKL